MAVIFSLSNWILCNLHTPENGRPYRVEVNRLSLQIEQEDFENVDLSQCEYVYNIAEYGENFYDTASDYIIREINGRLYRFDYTARSNANNPNIIIMVNVILAVMTAAVFGVLFYVRSQILRPFERLTNVPYELSKG
ncbi:MAG: sensor histidine kinase, partial [Oscillospiraceae bacterium]|nr:sensor histidine kinase [Oscillospiraceae bacterium]